MPEPVPLPLRHPRVHAQASPTVLHQGPQSPSAELPVQVRAVTDRRVSRTVHLSCKERRHLTGRTPSGANAAWATTVGLIHSVRGERRAGDVHPGAHASLKKRHPSGISTTRSTRDRMEIDEG